MKTINSGFYALVALVNANIETIFNSTNVSVVFDVNNALKSWVPGRSINNFDTIVKGNGYYVVSKGTIDLTGIFAGIDDLNATVGGAGAVLTIINQHTSPLTVLVFDAENNTLLEKQILANKSAVIDTSAFPSATHASVQSSGFINFVRGNVSQNESVNTIQSQTNYPMASNSRIDITDVAVNTLLHITAGINPDA